MLQALAKMIGKPRADAGGDSLSAWLEQVHDLLEPLGDRDGRRLAEAVVDYLRTGEPVSVLAAATADSKIGNSLGMVGSTIPGKALGLYERIEQLPLPVVVRWGRFVAASASGMTNWFGLKLPDGIHWPEALLMNALGYSLNGAEANGNRHGMSAEFLETLLAAEGLPRSTLLAAAFTFPAGAGWNTSRRLRTVIEARGYAQAIARHLEVLRPLALPAGVEQRLHVIAMLEPAESATLEALAPQLVELVISGSRQVRAGAHKLAKRGGTAIVDALRLVAVEGKPEQRILALQLVAELSRDRGQPEWMDFARATAAADKAPSVRSLIAEWDASANAPAGADGSALVYAVPVIDWSGRTKPMPDAFVDAVVAAINTAIEKDNEAAKQRHAFAAARGNHWPLNLEPVLDSADIAALKTYLAGDSPTPASPPKTARYSRWIRHHVTTEIVRLVTTQDDVSPVAVMKLLMFFWLVSDHQTPVLPSVTQCFEALHQRTGRPSLLELSVMLDATGHDGRSLFRPYCTAYGMPFASDWDPADVWPYFMHHRDTLLRDLQQGPGASHYADRGAVFRAVDTLPALPGEFVNALFAMAFGPSKSDRAHAQQALTRVPDKLSRIIAALSDGKADVRRFAAQWLGRLREPAALPALEKAVAAEKQDIAKGAMLDALQMMGQPVGKYLDRDALAAEARKGLAKAPPTDIEWFPWAAIPAVRWSDTGAPVPEETLRWLIVQAVKQKTTEPNAVLRKFCEMFDPRDREVFGQFVLDTWLAEDTKPISAALAERSARGRAQQMAVFYQKHPEYVQNDPKKDMTVDQLYAFYLPGYLRQPVGSAIGSKGLLAVAAACCGDRAAPAVHRYLKLWYGNRAAQGKALIAMLAWIEHPTAVQLMLAVGSRFRTRGFQEEATKQAEALADRKGWTLAELADRTVPAAGFDEAGRMELSYGERTFVAKLLPDFKIDLFNPDGKKIASLPEPRQDDDAEAAKESKKALSTAKKTLKGIVDLQTDRLYEALCTQRDWSFGDWTAFLQNHPVVRHMVQRLVWVQMDGDRMVRSFRPLDDGTLTDVEDNPVTVADDGRIRIAHDTLMPADQVAAWQQHLLDYKIKPLFAQMGKGAYVLPAEKTRDDELKDFQGHVIEAFALRGRATKLGYTRGSSEDGGWFYTYEKRFPTLGLVATIEFTGNGLPEENRTVALKSLSFSGGQERMSRYMKHLLGKMPAVLLSECYHDMRLIAAEGTGFDPDWQKKCDA